MPTIRGWWWIVTQPEQQPWSWQPKSLFILPVGFHGEGERDKIMHVRSILWMNTRGVLIHIHWHQPNEKKKLNGKGNFHNDDFYPFNQKFNLDVIISHHTPLSAPWRKPSETRFQEQLSITATVFHRGSKEISESGWKERNCRNPRRNSSAV